MKEITAGEHFTCIWSAIAFLRDEQNEDSSDKIPANNLETILSELGETYRFNFNKLQFRTYVSGDLVDFATCKEFMLLLKGQTEYCSFVTSVREFCWKKVQDKFCLEWGTALFASSTKAQKTKALSQIWDLVNLHMLTTYPPRLSKRDANRMIKQLLLVSGKEEEEARWKIGPEAQWKGNWTQIFQFLEKLNAGFEEPIGELVAKLHRRGVEEVMGEGLLYVNVKQGHNMFGWTKQYAILSPSGLFFYKDVNQKTLVSSHSFAADLKFANERNFVGFFRYLSFCWKITNAQDSSVSILLSGKDEKIREEWIIKSRKIVSCLNKNTSPYAELLKEMSSTDQEENTLLTDTPKTTMLWQDLRSTVLQSPHLLVEEDEKAGKDKKNVKFEEEEEEEEVDSQLDSIRASINQESDEMRQKIHAMFVKHDADGNGFLDSQEFLLMLIEFGLRLNKEDSESLFHRIKTHQFHTLSKGQDDDEDHQKRLVDEQEFANKVSCDAFYNFLKNLATVESRGSESVDDYKIKMLLMKGEGGEKDMDFKQILEYIGEKNHNMLQDRFENLFSELAQDASRESLENFFRKNRNRQTIKQALASEPSKIEFDLLAHINEEEVAEVQDIIKDRWDKFKSFKRQNRGVTVMQAPGDIKADLLPGEWNLMDLVMAQFSDDDLKDVEPSHTLVDGVNWISPKESEAHGTLVFPPDFDEEIQVDIATNQNLAFYGCCIADKSQEKIVTLLYRHGTQDFQYSSQYLEGYVEAAGGGAGIERHMFEHMDCPLDNDSGYFLIGKMISESQIALTAFKVLKRQVLYVPRNVIHSNDYLKGTWRTMLSDAAPIDHVYLTKKSADDQMDHFHFRFSEFKL